MDARHAARSFADISALVKHVPLPIYSYCRLHDGRLLASNGVTDMDLPFGEDGESSASNGNLLLPVQEMTTLCKALARAGEPVHWECDGDRIHVVHTYGDVWLKGLPIDLYPAATDLDADPDPLAEFSGKMFLQALRLVDSVLADRGAVSSHPAFDGAFLEVHEGGFILVGMDGPCLAGYRLAHTDANPIWSGILPRNTVALLIKRLSAALPEGGSVLFSGSAVGARFSFADEHISTRLIDGEYPDWRKALVARNDLPARVSLDALAQVLELCAIGSLSAHLVPVKLQFSRDCLAVTTSHEHGEAQQSLPAEYRAGKLSMIVNGRLLLALAKALADSVESDAIDVLHDGSPVRALRLTLGDGKAFCVLMPMRESVDTNTKEEVS
jgi:DNA polymerase-3 subunit beta